jgi:invasion protein IalB
MSYRKVCPRPAGIGLAVFAALAMAATLASPVLAQQPARPAQRPATPAPAPKPAAPQAGQPAQPPQQQVQLIYSPWTKICKKPPGDNAKEFCFTGKDARIESGLQVVAAVLVEPQGEARKILQITLPLRVSLTHGTRLIIDQGQPATAPYVICHPVGCVANYEVNADVIANFKKGQTLYVQAINENGAVMNIPLSLTDFAKAYDGPPTDPKVVEEQQKKLQEELQRRADEARKKLEAQPK